jgi:replicative DNA helicase
MDAQILKALLDHSFFTDNENRLGEKLFGDEYRELYSVLAEAHKKYGHDISADELSALWRTKNPVATRADISAINEIIEDVADSDTPSYDVARDIISYLWRREIGRQIANLGLEMSEGNDDAMQRLQRLVTDNAASCLPDEFGENTTTDLDELLAITGDESRWQFNLPTLSRHVYGIGPAEFGIVFATPETGKTAFLVSLMAGPDGFASQGAKTIYLGNEEATRRTMLRAYQAYTGMCRDDIALDPFRAKQRFRDIEQNLIMKDIQEWDLAKIESFIIKEGADVVIIDQADKVQIGGAFNAGHERLRALYNRLRELSKKCECAIIGVSQASAEASNKSRLDYTMMEGSKIGKAAEADLIIGIGRLDSGSIENSEPDHTRYITVSKNKLSGWHGTVICNIEPKVSRYVV